MLKNIKFNKILEISKRCFSKDTENKRQWTVLPLTPRWRARSPAIQRLWLERQKDTSKQSSFMDNNSKIERVLIPKLMKDSYVEEVLKFKSDEHIREEYMNTYGGIRISKVLEDLDALAGSIAYLHCDDNMAETLPLTIVTASVDRIDLLGRIVCDEDYKISGNVTYVGKSSMEISMQLEILNDLKDNKPILLAKFVMVARDPITGKASMINPLKLETDEDRKLFRLGAEHKARKQALWEMNLEKQPDEIQKIINDTIIHGLSNHGKFSLFAFSRFLGQHELKEISNNIDRFVKVLSCVPKPSITKTGVLQY
jgi:acyl-coenzyme A thioesterase 9